MACPGGRGFATHSPSNAMCTGVGLAEHLSEQARGTAGEGALTFVGWDLKAPRRPARAMAQRHFDFAATPQGGLGLDEHD